MEGVWLLCDTISTGDEKEIKYKPIVRLTDWSVYDS